MTRFTYSARCAQTLVCLVGCGIGCTPELVPPDLVGEYSLVSLIGTEQLERPDVGRERAFKATQSFAIDTDDASAGQAVGFFVTLTVADPDFLLMRLVDVESGVVTPVVSIARPANNTEIAVASEPRAFNDASRSELRTGSGVFWLADEGGNTDDLTHRLAVVIPDDVLRPVSRLEMYVSHADDGTPLGVARMELVRDFFYFVVIGDSVQWGNGLREDEKMSTLVMDVIQRETDRKVIFQRYAQSGAKIVPAEGDGICEVNCFGEAPTIATSITLQVDQIQRPELVDLILMDGCINDVGVEKILNPLLPRFMLVERTEQLCGEEMITLVQKVRSVAPQAHIVIAGYFQIVSQETELFGLETYVAANGVDPDAEETNDSQDEAEGLDDQDAPDADPEDTPSDDADPEQDDPDDEDWSLVDTLTDRSIAFFETAHASLAAAADTINGSIDGDPLVVFADPGFGPQNAVFASDRWLWSMGTDSATFSGIEVDFELFPEDSVAAFRSSVCLDAGITSGLIVCLYASAGHPNPTGARAYADAIESKLRELGVLPASPTGGGSGTTR